MRTGLMKLMMAMCVLGAGKFAVAQEFIPVHGSAVAGIAETADQIAAEKAAFQTAELRAVSGITLPYRLLLPADVTAGVRYPLVLMLHGSDVIGTDNFSQLSRLAPSWASPRLRKEFPAYVVAPQFPARSANYETSKEDNMVFSQAGEPLGAALELIDYLVKNYPIDQDRIYIVGFSMGASSGWHAMLNRPKLFAGAVLMSGTPPKRSRAVELADVPILMTHGNVDPQNPLEPDRLMFASIQKAGGTKARFREYDNLPHAVPPDVLAVGPEGDWWRLWLFAQRRSPSIGQ
jgi:predicted peptidase